MKLLAKEQQESCENAKFCYICREKFEDKSAKNKKKKHCKFRVNCRCLDEYKGAAQNICNLKYNVPKEIHTVFHNGSNYHYHLIIKEQKNLKGNLLV